MVRFALVAALVGCRKDGDDGDDTPTGPTADGGWSETAWCGTDLADLSAVEAAHDPGRLRESVLGISAVRYPPAVAFVDAQTDAELARWFFSGTQTLDQVLEGYEVAVHEGCHIWGFDAFGAGGYSYRIVDDDFIVDTPFLQNFDRSEVLGRHPYAAQDFYADTYLTGASGAQGFNTVLDEFNAYTHSLVSRYCTRDSIQGATSARDGIRTFQLYVELYLKIAREEHPADYAAITGDPATVEVVLAVWDRAEYWLAITASSPELGIDDAFIEGFVSEPENLDEIDRLR
jgi:hypothetical protein